MLMLDGSSLAGVVAPLPLDPLDQLQPLETRMPFFSDDDVVVFRDAQGLCDFHKDLVISISVARGRRITRGTIVDQNVDDLRVLAPYHNIHARAERKVDQCRDEAGDVDRIIIGRSWPTCQFRGDKVRAHNQSQDRQRARPRRSREAVRPRRRVVE
jgi:hypothetical protein